MTARNDVTFHGVPEAEFNLLPALFPTGSFRRDRDEQSRVQAEWFVLDEQMLSGFRFTWFKEGWRND